MSSLNTQENDFLIHQNDLKYLVAAAFVSFGILAPQLLMWDWAIYVTFAFLGINAAAIVLASGILFNPDVFERRTSNRQVWRNHALQLLIQILTATFLYKVYLVGHVFAAGFFTFMLSISVMSNIFTSIMPQKGK